MRQEGWGIFFCNVYYSVTLWVLPPPKSHSQGPKCGHAQKLALVPMHTCHLSTLRFGVRLVVGILVRRHDKVVDLLWLTAADVGRWDPMQTGMSFSDTKAARILSVSILVSLSGIPIKQNPISMQATLRFLFGPLFDSTHRLCKSLMPKRLSPKPSAKNTSKPWSP